MKEVVTYIFGAGASAASLPVTENIPDRLLYFKQSFEENHPTRYDLEPFKKAIIDDVEWLCNELASTKIVDGTKKITPKQSSVDTYAKTLWIHNDQNLEKLKVVLSLLFVFEQTIKNPDPRYNTFFASIINNQNLQLPDSIRIISWNYDAQFELAFRQFSKARGIKENQETLGIITKHIYDRIPRSGFERNLDRFSIYKINGTASFYHYRIGKEIIPMREDSTIDLYDSICELYQNYKIKDSFLSPSLSFAWEKEDIDPNIAGRQTTYELAVSQIQNTRVLVIVGYSFPQFNRQIDTMILKAMNHVERIYIQDLHPELVKEALIDIRHDFQGKIFNRRVDKYYLPSELTTNLLP